MAIQVVIEIGDLIQDLEEMADLFYELLNSNTSIAALTPPLWPLLKLSMIILEVYFIGKSLPRSLLNAYEMHEYAYQVYIISPSCLANVSIIAS
jgi:hypothetical protein